MVNKLVVALDARQALVVVEAAEHEGAVFGQRTQQRITRILPVLYLVPKHLQHGRQDVGEVGQSFHPRTTLERTRGVNQEWHPETFLPDGIVVLVAAVLAESLAVITVEDEDGVLVEPQLLVLLDEVLQEDVLEAEAVEVAVGPPVIREVLASVAGGEASVVVVSRARQVLGHERFVPALF